MEVRTIFVVRKDKENLATHGTKQCPTRSAVQTEEHQTQEHQLQQASETQGG